MATIALLLGIAAMVSTVLTTIQAMLVWRLRRTTSLPHPPHKGFVSILKPVCGLDDELEANLESFVSMRGVRYEVIISAESADDPALEIVRNVLRAHPEAPFRIVVDAGSTNAVVNRKVERLIAAARVAAGDVFLISDSNVRVSPDDISRTVALLSDASVGCVSNVFTGCGAADTGSTVESLHLLGFVVTGAALAAAAGVPCVVGKSMALSRAAHDAIGGFARFRTVLAEDQAIGLAVRAAGFRIVLSPVVVRNIIVNRTIKRAAERQIRWNKIRYAFSRPLFAAELLLNPLALAVAATAFNPRDLMLVPVVVLVARWMQFAILNRVTDSRLRWRQLALVPVLDLMMLCTWVVPFLSNRVVWRGHHARVGRHTQLLPA